MPVSLSCEGLSVVTTKSSGKCNATIPDICKTPMPPTVNSLPLPYPNVAKSEDLKGGSILAKVDGGSVALFGSYVSKSEGDAPGSMGGIISGTTEGKAFFINCSQSFMIEGRPVCRKSDMMIMNDMNTIGLAGMSQDDVEEPEEQEEKSVTIKLTDVNGEPKADELFQIVHSGKVQSEGQLDAQGQAQISGMKGSNFKIKFPNQIRIKKI